MEFAREKQETHKEFSWEDYFENDYLEVRKRWNNNIAMGFGLLDILIFYGLK
jgi:hypothetical protein